MKPLGNKIQLDIKEVKIGAIQSDSITEKGTIVALGAQCDSNNAIKVGRTLYFKAWGVDVITEGDKKYYFINADSEAICAYE